MFLQGPECFSIPPEAVFLSDCVFMCVCVCTRWRLAAFVYLKHVGAKKKTSYALQMSSCLIIKPALSRSCELYYKRYLHTPSACVDAHIQPLVRAHTPPPGKNPPQLKSGCIKGSCLSSRFISVIFSSLSLSRLCHFTRLLFFPSSAHSLVLLPSLFSPPDLFFTFASLSALPTCRGRCSSKGKSDVF